MPEDEDRITCLVLKGEGAVDCDHEIKYLNEILNRWLLLMKDYH